MFCTEMSGGQTSVAKRGRIALPLQQLPSHCICLWLLCQWSPISRRDSAEVSKYVLSMLQRVFNQFRLLFKTSLYHLKVLIHGGRKRLVNAQLLPYSNFCYEASFFIFLFCFVANMYLCFQIKTFASDGIDGRWRTVWQNQQTEIFYRKSGVTVH